MLEEVEFYRADHWWEAFIALRQEMSAWISESIERQKNTPWQGSHDEGTFTASWAGYYLLSGDQHVLDYMKQLRDEYAQWARANQFHGYHKEAEVHHGPETHWIFLATLWHLDKEDQVTVNLLEDAAHHIGNWVPEVPPWYDWDNHRFLSCYLGTEVVKNWPPYDIEIPEHLRFAAIALTTYLATKKERYLHLAQDYVERWCNLILESEEIPLAIYADSKNPQESYSTVLAKFVGAAPKDVSNEINRIESHVANGTIDVLLDLFTLTQKAKCLDAAKRLVLPLVAEIADPYAQPPALIFSKYRRISGDTSHDHRIMELIGFPDQREFRAAVMDTEFPWGEKLSGVGKRRDMVRWYYRTKDGRLEEKSGPPPSALMLAYQISGDSQYLQKALEVATMRLRLARKCLPDGRKHGCSARTISAIARGHGRDNGAGNITATLYPAALGTMYFYGGDCPEITYYHQDGRLGLPQAAVAAIIVFPKGESKIVLFSSDKIRIVIKPEDTTAKISKVRINNVEVKSPKTDYVEVDLPPEQQVEVRILLNPGQ